MRRLGAMSTIAAQESLTREQFEVEHDQTVRTEIETFRQRAEAFLAGQITENEFRPFRLKHGIYGQRQPGVQMVRCKIPTGLLTASQLDQLGTIADEFVPEERLIQKCEAVIRVFNQHGNRQNKFKARMKFVMRERGFEWLKAQIEKEYANILAEGGIPMPEMVPE